MVLSTCQPWESIDRFVEAFTQQRLSRRNILRALALGLPLIAGGTLVTSCRETSPSPSSVTILAIWGGEEQASFQAMVAPFTQQTGIRVQVISTLDVTTELMLLLQAYPPDIAILPNPAEMRDLASQDKLIALDTLMDTDQLRKDYDPYWIDLGSYQGTLYGVFVKGANKGTIWYSPAQFQSLGLQTPSTWRDLISLSNQIASSGKYPWSMGVESGVTSGWPAADWVAQIYLNQFGPTMYDQWWQHKIPWTDSSIKQAFQLFGEIAHGPHYINGAPQSILTTGFQNASYEPYENPPQSYMDYLGDFTEGFITSQFPSLKPGRDFNFFPFPTTNLQGLTVRADLVVALRKTNEVGKLVQYLATAPAQEIWVKRGGFLSLNGSVDPRVYPNTVSQASAMMLRNPATAIRFGVGDLMPFIVQQAFWSRIQDYIRDASELNIVLSQIEATAQQAY